MKIHHLRNASFLCQIKQRTFLFDPMLGAKHSQPPFALIRHKIERNPTVELPPNAMNSLQNTTQCFITHLHPDHADKAGLSFLKSKQIPIICSEFHEKTLRRQGMNIHSVIKPWQKTLFYEGTIVGIPCSHGTGVIGFLMGKVMGYYIEFPEDQSIYVSSDTIFTKDVETVLRRLRPKLSVLACGAAQLDLGKNILMSLDEIVKFVELAPGKVYANHMEALNHCPITRDILRKKLSEKGLLQKVLIPADGESFEI